MTGTDPDDDDDLARVGRAARQAVDAGDGEAARTHLLEAVGIARRRSDPAEASRALVLASRLSRIMGEADQATELAREAEDLADTDPSLRAAALLEQAEIAAATGSSSRAAQLLTTLLGVPGASRADRAAAHRGRARARLAMDRPGDAAEDHLQAGRLLGVEGDTAGAAQGALDAATALTAAGDVTRAEALLATAAEAARDIDLPGLRAQVALARATLALQRGDGEAALTEALTAREEALIAVDAVAFAGATGVIAVLEERRGDRVAAYRALATGWATIADLLGSEVAAAMFSPPLLDQQQRWGADGFAAVKAEHDEQAVARRGA
jgi:ATP/maltotriose-dependent transcriptional regulator MalT